MLKTLQIALKDLRITLRDPMALVLMLVAPLGITLVMAAAFGGSSSGGSAGLSSIPVVIVNQDGGQFSTYLVEAYSSKEVGDLLAPTQMSDAAAARALVDSDEAAAAVIIPPNFSASILPAGLQTGDLSALQNPQTSEVEIYANPTRPISANVVRAVTDAVINRFLTGLAAGKVSVSMLLATGRIQPDQASAIGELLGRQAVQGRETNQRLVVESHTAEQSGGAADQGFNWLAYMSPSMAILYLMFTMTAGARSLLAERDRGTLPRLFTSPTTRWQVLGGKMLGTYLTGVAQMFVLILATWVLYRIQWGNPLGVVLVTLSVVLAATGWGMLVAVISKRAGQANAFGTALTLIFAALAGNFVPRMLYPQWLQTAGYITPNAWGIESYYGLINGQSLASVLPAVLAMLVMAALTFTVAVLAFRRQYA